MDSYGRLIEEARRKINRDGEAPSLDWGGQDVQMSMRIPIGLRDAVHDVARRRGQTLTAFMTEILVATVGAERDPFVALASDLAEHTRDELAAAVAAGDYASVAAEVDTGDAAWADS